MLLHVAQLVADAVARAGLLGPARVHDGRLVVIGKEAHQLGPIVASSDDLVRVGLDLGGEGRRDVLCFPARHRTVIRLFEPRKSQLTPRRRWRHPPSPFARLPLLPRLLRGVGHLGLERLVPSLRPPGGRAALRGGVGQDDWRLALLVVVGRRARGRGRGLKRGRVIQAVRGWGDRRD
eukprot:scaffold8643_cov63-Phaeocystis_antarctica.AAC.2